MGAEQSRRRSKTSEVDRAIEEHILLLVQKGRYQEAIGAAYTQYSIAIYRYIRIKVPSGEIAEDLTSDVFFRALSNIGSFECRGESIKSWLFTIAHNAVIDYYRKTSRRSGSLFALEEGLDSSGDVLTWSSGSAPLISRIVEVRQDLIPGLNSLPPLERSVIRHRYGHGMSNAEVARQLGSTEGGVKSAHHRALVKMRQIMDGEAPRPKKENRTRNK